MSVEEPISLGLQDRLDSLRQYLVGEEPDRARELLGDMAPVEHAELLQSLPANERGQVWRLLSPTLHSEILPHLEDAVRAALLEEMDPQQVAQWTQELAADDAADVLQDLPKDRIDRVLRSMSEQNRRRLTSLLSYPEDQAGGLMDADVVLVRADVTLDVVVRYLRRLGKLPKGTDSLMVVDRNNRYLGVLPLAGILMALPTQTVGEIIYTGIEPIRADLPAVEAAKRFAERDLLSAPVLDRHGYLLGRITVDDALDVLQERADQTMFNMVGVREGDEMFAPVWRSAWRRGFWLGINLLTAFLASWVIGRFEESIRQLVPLAVLMPIVASMGGIAGNQTLAVAIRGLALKRLGRANAPLLLRKELAVGALNGLVWALVVAFIATQWFDDFDLGIVFGLAILFNLLVAALAGALIPLFLHACRVDPALAGGVVLTTVTDVVGFLSFLGLGTVLLL